MHNVVSKATRIDDCWHTSSEHGAEAAGKG